MVRSEGNVSLKNPVTPTEIDPGTVRLVAQRLNHYATPGPHVESKPTNNCLPYSAKVFTWSNSGKIKESFICDNWSMEQGSKPGPPKYESEVWRPQMLRLVLTECRAWEFYLVTLSTAKII